MPMELRCIEGFILFLTCMYLVIELAKLQPSSEPLNFESSFLAFSTEYTEELEFLDEYKLSPSEFVSGLPST